MKKALTLLLLFTAFLGFSQNSYQPGYFISNDGSKTECLIRNIGWKDNPTNFEYKLTETAETQKADIKTIQEFNVTEYQFKRYTVDIDRWSSDISNMSSKKSAEWKKETLFLKVMVLGKATLFYYEDNNLSRYFVSIDNNATAQQLVYKQYDLDGKIAYNYAFRGQLYTIMKTDLKDPERFKYLKYDREQLVKLFLEYNGNTGQEVVNLSESQNKTIINFKITPGVSFTSLSTTSRTGLTQDYDFKDKAIFRIGAEVEAILPFNNGKWALFADPNYQAYKKNEVDTRNNKWQIDFKYLELPFGVRHYMYITKKSKIFIDAAYVLAINLGKSQLDYTYSNAYASYGFTADINKSSNFALGAGYNYQKFSAEVRYNFSRQLLANYADWNTKYTSIGLILGYKLF